MSGGLEGLLAGRTLVKRYAIEEPIGRGGFAVVYRATDTRLGRPVAVKVITLAAHDEQAREQLRKRLHREARAAAGLPHHPNLVTVHDVGTDPELGLDFLVLELLEGETLAAYLGREGKPPLETALRVLRGAAEGIAVGHRAGLVHRDVKPANLFLASPHGDESGPFRVCVLDYGIAQAIEDDATMTRGEASPLSPAYASPEQLRGERDLAPASDVFSLGVVGYQLLTGERPFSPGPGQAPQGWTVRRPIRELEPSVPAAVEAVLMRAMSVDPGARYPDADAFVAAMDAALAAPDDDATGVLPAGAVGAATAARVPLPADDDHTVLAPPPATAPPPAAPPAAYAPARRRSPATAIVLGIALLLAAAAAWAAFAGGGGDADPVAGVPADTAAEAATDTMEPAPPPPVMETTPEPAGGDPGDTVEPDPALPVDAPPAEPADPAAPAPGEPAVPAPPQPSAEPQQPSAPPQQPTPPPSQPSREPEPPPAQPPRQQPQPPRPAPPEPGPPPAQQPQLPQPVIVQPRPAPGDTIRIGPPR